MIQYVEAQRNRKASHRSKSIPSIARDFLTVGSGWFSLFQSGGTPKTNVVPNCSRAMPFQKEIQVVRTSPAS